MPKDIFNLTTQQVEGVYARAYNFYQVGRYSEAAQIFRVLMMLNGSETKYVLGLAACFQMLKEYKDAADIYTFCTLIDPQNPIPYYHMSDCFMNLKDIPSAKVALKMAIQKAGEKAEYQILKDRSILTLQHLDHTSKSTIKNR
ncbi:MAG: SycD/LcrH family type III secretion system chaperone [Parachlamydiaceae bacterium]|nr:MAG: SycD/LcrH family type III secretion system chaperone [Parachlamydiaceae bacterium]